VTRSPSENALDVVVAGCIGIDTTVFLYGQDIDFNVEANFSQNIDCVGQAGGYCARGFRRLGNRVGFVGSVGADYNGDFIRRELASDGIETLFFPDPVGTHRSINFMYRDGRRKNFYDGKGSMEVKPDLAACEALLSRTRLVHVHIENWCRELLPIARRCGVLVSCDLQDVVALDDPYRRDFIEQADILFFSCTNHPNPSRAIDFFLTGNPNRIVVGGMGAQGAVLGTREGIRMFAPPPLDLPVLDTNGAGDSLAFGFLTSHVLEGRGLEESVMRGQVAARVTCSQRATSSELVTRERLEALCSSLGR